MKPRDGAGADWSNHNRFPAGHRSRFKLGTVFSQLGQNSPDYDEACFFATESSPPGSQPGGDIAWGIFPRPIIWNTFFYYIHYLSRNIFFRQIWISVKRLGANGLTYALIVIGCGCFVSRIRIWTYVAWAVCSAVVGFVSALIVLPSMYLFYREDLAPALYGSGITAKMRNARRVGGHSFSVLKMLFTAEFLCRDDKQLTSFAVLCIIAVLKSSK